MSIFSNSSSGGSSGGSSGDFSGGLILNPQLPDAEKKIQVQLFKKFLIPDHFFMTSSGSSKKKDESLKLVALSKEAFLTSAHAVNKHLETDRKDVWMNPLPLFHVGGLATLFRARSGGYQWHSFWKPDRKWQANEFVQQLKIHKVTLTSLVPTQLFDLVQMKFKSPSSLRAAIIGGDRLSPLLAAQAKKLGWPILASYGMTETCSQIATEKFAEEKPLGLMILQHAKVTLSTQGLIQIQSPSLLTGYAQQKKSGKVWIEPVKRGIFVTQDLGEIKKSRLFPMGRKSRFVKILGEGVSLDHLENTFEIFLAAEGFGNWMASLKISARGHSRNGHELEILHEKKIPKLKLQSLLDRFNQQQPALQKIQKIKTIDSLPRSALGKILAVIDSELSKKMDRKTI